MQKKNLKKTPKSTEFSVPAKIQLQKKLAKNLTTYTSISQENKSKIQNLLAFFQGKKNPERRINHVAKKLFSNVSKSQSMNARIEKAKVEMPWKMKLPFMATLLDLRTFYHKTAEKFARIPELDGNWIYLSIDSIIKDLKNYDKEFEGNTFKQMTEAFEFARAISKLTDKWYNDPQNLQLLSQSIFEKVQQLHIPADSEKEYLILSGGYRGHTVLYYIERYQNGKFSFSIINTGSGLTPLKYPAMVDKNGVLHDEAHHLAVDKELLAISWKYDDLTEEDLSQQFFEVLLNCKESNSSMTKVEVYIENALRKEGNFRIGYVNEIQKNGTCSMRCLLSLININIDDVINSKKFNLFMLKNELKKFDENLLLKISCLVSPVLSDLKKHVKENIATLEKEIG